MTESAIGVDIGGTKISAGVVDAGGAVVGIRTVASPSQLGTEAMIDAVVDLVSDFPVGLRLGVGTAGTVDDHGAVIAATDAIRGWRGTDLRARLTDRLDRSVTVLNDVHAAARAEALVGAAVGWRDFLTVTVGTGVGGALHLDGELRVGPRGAAGSIGHVTVLAGMPRRCPCGHMGHVEAYASGPAMETAFREATGQDFRVPEIAALAARGDPDATGVLDGGARALGAGLAVTTALLDLDGVVIGGGVAQLGDPYLDAIRLGYDENVVAGAGDLRLVPARSGVHATLIGAGLAALA